eukprot:13207021-Ditylum_brightwellii.AAC.1
MGFFWEVVLCCIVFLPPEAVVLYGGGDDDPYPDALSPIRWCHSQFILGCATVVSAIDLLMGHVVFVVPTYFAPSSRSHLYMNQ